MNRNFGGDLTNDSTTGGSNSSVLNPSIRAKVSRSASIHCGSGGNKSFGANTSLSQSCGNFLPHNSNNTCKTPSKRAARKSGALLQRLTPSRNHAILKRSSTGTGSLNCLAQPADRFVPNRDASHFDLGNFRIANESRSCNLNGSMSEPSSPAKHEQRSVMRNALNGGATAAENQTHTDMETSMRILAYNKGKAPLGPSGYVNSDRVLYSANRPTVTSCTKTARHIPTSAEKILDAPEIVDDFYLHPIDWDRCTNRVAVALGGQVYLWDATSQDIVQLLQLDNANDYVSCVRWSSAGYLAVALSTGDVQVWDTLASRRVRNLRSHTERVPSADWFEHLLSTGCKNGTIVHHDVRVAQHEVAAIQEAHVQEVCGLRWSPDGRYLASGGNDNLVKIWRHPAGEGVQPGVPAHELCEHLAAVKALAWCPWQSSILATGGGTKDKCIRIWNAQNGSCLSTVDTESQVSALLWSSEYKELLSAHGWPTHSLLIWKYPQMNKIAQIGGHEGRILEATASPCGEYVMTAAADETLRVWHAFAVDANAKKKRGAQAVKQDKKTAQAARSALTRGIR